MNIIDVLIGVGAVVVLGGVGAAAYGSSRSDVLRRKEMYDRGQEAARLFPPGLSETDANTRLAYREYVDRVLLAGRSLNDVPRGELDAFYAGYKGLPFSG